MPGSHTPSGSHPMIGRTIGNYIVRERIGQGGMGAVYLAEHPRIHRKVAIKVLHPELGQDPEIVARFFNEARAANDIRNEHIVEILDFGELPEGTSYFIMEWLEGRSLGDALQAGRLPLDRAAHITTGVGRALAAAHSHGVIHRDLKPDNIYLVRRDDDAEFVKVLDFGIAKLLASTDGSAPKTATNVVMGTPAYMSPEQCRGESSTLDARSDVYSLGVIVYEMVTGQRPFHSETYTGILVAHLTQAPPALRRFEPRVPAAVEKVVMQALEKDPERRFQHVVDLVNALSAAVGVPGITAPRAVSPLASPSMQIAAAAPPPNPARSAPAAPLVIAPTPPRNSAPSLQPLVLDKASDNTGAMEPARNTVRSRTLAAIGAVVVLIGLGLALMLRQPASPLSATGAAPTHAGVVAPAAAPLADAPHITPLPLEPAPQPATAPSPSLPAPRPYSDKPAAVVEVAPKKPEPLSPEVAAGESPSAKPATKETRPEPAPIGAKPAARPGVLDPYDAEVPVPPARAAARPVAKPAEVEEEIEEAKPVATNTGGDDLDRRLAAEAAHLAPGARRVGSKLRGEGDDGEGQDRYVQLEEGRCYTFVSVGTSPRLYTYLWGPDGDRVADHRSDTNVSHFEHCAEESGQYHFQAKPARGAGEFRTAVYQSR